MMQTLLLALLMPCNAHAQDTLPPAARAAWAEMSQAARLQAHFEQTRTSSLLSKPLVSTGTLRCQRPDKIAWTVDTPARSTLVLDGSTMSVSYPDLGVQEQVELSDDPEVERLVRSTMVWLSGDLDQVSHDFTVQWTEGEPDQALLVPRDPTVGKLLGRLTLSISGDPLRVTAVDIAEPDGDWVHIALTDVVLDPVLPLDTFRAGSR